MIEIGPQTGRADILRIAGGTENVRLSPAARDRIAAGHRALTSIAADRPVYGRSTGVGANVSVVPAGDLAAHDRDLLVSHAVTAGPPVPHRAVRAMVAVRLCQLGAGRSGVSVSAAQALCDLLAADRLPTVGAFHGVGTGDLGALAAVALSLPDAALAPGDALPLMSSSALTVARAVLVADAVESWWRSAVRTAGLTADALDGSREAWDDEALGRSPGVREAAAALRSARSSAAAPAAVQDPYGLRTAPQQLGLLRAALDRLAAQLDLAVADGPENPAVLTGSGRLLHNGAFHILALTEAVDQVSGALGRAGYGCLQRIGLLMRPFRDRPQFLAAAPGRSGLMSMEYIAASALAEVRASAVPAGLQTASLGLGVETDASFAPQAVSQLERSVSAARVVVAAELLAAIRATGLAGRRVDPRFGALAEVVEPVPDDVTGLLAAAQDLLAGE